MFSEHGLTGMSGVIVTSPVAEEYREGHVSVKMVQKDSTAWVQQLKARDVTHKLVHLLVRLV